MNWLWSRLKALWLGLQRPQDPEAGARGIIYPRPGKVTKLPDVPHRVKAVQKGQA